MNNWIKVDENNSPANRVPYIVWGVLEGESAPDSHEGFYDQGLEWLSVRHNWIDERPNMSIKNVTHFMSMPGSPEEEEETVCVPRTLTGDPLPPWEEVSRVNSKIANAWREVEKKLMKGGV